jgi:hypothetical protein
MLKSYILWDITPCSPVLIDVSKEHGYSACCLFYAGFPPDSLFYPEDGGDMFLRNVG